MQTMALGGFPRVDTERLALKRQISLGQPPLLYISKRVIIDGSKTRDPGNTGSIDSIRPGTLFGKITSSGYYAPSVLGVTQAAYTNGGLAITVTAAQAVEIARRIGTSGNLKYVGPPSAAGTVAVTGSIAFSAIDTATGIITVSTLGANFIAGTLVCSTDGSHLPVFPLGEDGGIKVTDYSGASQNQDYNPPVDGALQFGQLLPAVTDTSLIAWIKLQLATACRFTYDNDF